MANWKKVIVSGSDAELHHITASGNITASGFLFGNLPLGDNAEVVIYDTATGQLRYKELNLINTRTAPGLFLADITSDVTQTFRLSYDTGSSNLTTPYEYEILSASIDGGGSYTITPANNIDWVGINNIWNSREPSNINYYTAGGLDVNITSSISGSRQGLRVGGSKSALTLGLQAIDGNSTAVPLYNSADNPNYNYLAESFNDGLSGSLEVYFNNNSTPVVTAILTSSAGIDITAGGVNIVLSPARQNVDGSSGDDDPNKVARSGSITIAANDQRDGYNFAYLIHTGSKDGNQFTRITNFNEWFYDLEGSGLAMGITNQGILENPIFDATATSSISGIKFFNTNQSGYASASYGAKITNQYRNVYPTTAGITFQGITGDTISNINISQTGQYQTATSSNHAVGTSDSATISANLASLQNTANAATSDTEITASIDISFDIGTNDFYQPSGFIDSFTSTDIEASNNIITFQPKFTHITSHKADQTLDQVTLGDYMLNQLTAGANRYEFEDFRGEEYRIQSKSYDENDDPGAVSHEWDGTKNIINGGDGFNKGAIQYYSHLLYPTGAGVGGTFDVSLGPTGSEVQPTNYNTATGEREYYRYFQVVTSPINQTGNKSINLEIVGSGKVVADDHTTHFGNGDNDAVKIFAMRNEGNSFSNFNGKFVNIVSSSIRDQGTLFNNTNTQWIPMASSTSNIAYGDTTVTVGGITVPRGVVKFGEKEASANSMTGNEEIIIKIVIPENFAGYIDAILLHHGIQTTSRMNSQYSSAI